MSQSWMSSGLLFLVETVFNLYIIVVLLRFLLQGFGVFATNPILHLFHTLTQPLIAPFNRVIPTIRGFDLRLLVLALLLAMLEMTVIALLAGTAINVLALLVLGCVQVVRHIIDIFFFAIIGSVILSFMHPAGHHPIVQVIRALSEPLLRPARRILPPVSGFDLSPIPVLVFLKLLEIILVAIVL